MEDGALSEALLHHALVIQRSRSAHGSPQHFGELVVELGFVSALQLQRALDRQKLESRASTRVSA